MNELSTQSKKTVLIAIVVSTIVCLATLMGLLMLTGFFSAKTEKLEITSCEWSQDLHSGEVVGASFSIKNTGETLIIISQLRINNTLLNHEEWFCSPSHKLESGEEGRVYISPSIMTFEEGLTYTFSLITESGKTFTHTANLTVMKIEQLKIQGCTFNGTSGISTNTIVLTVQNTGNADLTIDKYKLDETLHDITDVSIAQEATATVICTNAGWASGVTYNIYLITASGLQFQYSAAAP